MAEDAADAAADSAAMAVAAAAAELKIDGTVKSVGDTTIDAMAENHRLDVNDEVTDTGKQGDVETPGAATAGVQGVSADPEGNPAVKYVAPVAGAMSDDLTIGKRVDSADDTARLLIIDFNMLTRRRWVWLRLAMTVNQ